MALSKKRIRELEAITDDQIDFSDIPELDDDFWKNAVIVRPNSKKAISLRLDTEIVSWFKNQGKGYQTYINSVLSSYVQAQKAQKS